MGSFLLATALSSNGTQTPSGKLISLSKVKMTLAANGEEDQLHHVSLLLMMIKKLQNHLVLTALQTSNSVLICLLLA